MKRNNIFSKLTVFLLLFVGITTYQTFAQENNKLTFYESPEQMVAAAKEVITQIPVEEFKDIYTRDDIYIIDVRTAAEYDAGAVPGAVNIPRGVLEFRIGDEERWESEGKNPPQKDEPIIVYCSSGSRGALSAKALMQLGYENVKSVKGGWEAWHEVYPDIKE